MLDEFESLQTGKHTTPNENRSPQLKPTNELCEIIRGNVYFSLFLYYILWFP